MKMKRQAEWKLQRLAACVAAVGMVFTLSACGGGSSDGAGPNTPVVNGGTGSGGPGSGGPGSGGPGSGGPGSGGPGSGGGQTGACAGVPGLDAASCDIVDNKAIYADAPNMPLDDVDVTVLAPTDAAGGCTDGSSESGHGRVGDKGAGVEDYSGCTLADLNAFSLKSKDEYDPYVRVEVSTADGQLKGAPGKMKLNGHSSLGAQQKSFKIKLDKGGQLWYGQRDVVFKKHHADLTRIRNTLAFTLFRSIPDFASRRLQFTHMHIVDQSLAPGDQLAGVSQDYGLFETIEEDDDQWLADHGQDAKGELWKAASFNFAPRASKAGLSQPVDSVAFENVIEAQGDGYDPNTALFPMLDAVNDDKDSNQVIFGNDFETVFKKYFHPDNFRTWLAVNILLNNTDTLTQNYYLYRPSSLTQFYFLPWDYDGSLDFYRQGGKPSSQERWRQGVSNWWGNMLVRRYLEEPGELANLTAKVDDLYAGVLSAQNVSNVMNGLPLATIKPIITSAPDVNTLPTRSGQGSADSQWQAEVDRLPTTVDTMYAQYLQTLARPMPGFVSVNPITTKDGSGNVTGATGVTLRWDQSWSLYHGQDVSYDVVLSTSPQGPSGDPNCTADDSSISQLAPAAGIAVPLPAAGQRSVVVTLPPTVAGTPQRYYVQIIMRAAAPADQPTSDGKDYCQISYGSYTQKVGTKSTRIDGVRGFDYDSNETNPSTDADAVGKIVTYVTSGN